MHFSQRIASSSKKLIFSFVLAALFIAAVPNTLLAQGEVSLWGSVTDSSGAAVAGAAVTVINLETGSSRALVTDEAGRVDRTARTVGHYEGAASKAGFPS